MAKGKDENKQIIVSSFSKTTSIMEYLFIVRITDI